jgi:hypothetical protein
MARELYGHAPPAILFTDRRRGFRFPTGLSKPVQQRHPAKVVKSSDRYGQQGGSNAGSPIMHELSIAEAILDLARRNVPRGATLRIRAHRRRTHARIDPSACKWPGKASAKPMSP